MFLGKNKKYFIYGLLSFAILFFVFLFATQALAATSTVNFGLKPVQEGLGLAGTDIRLIVARIIRIFLGLLGVIAIGIVIWGGVVYMTAAGNEEKVNQGKKILTNGLIGLAIILSAFSIASFIINQLAGATGIGKPGEDNKCADTNFASDPNNCKTCYGTLLDYCDSCEKNHFVVKSITPTTTNTNMNNVTARAIFSRPINYKAGDVKISQGSKDVSDKFNFSLIGDESVVEAQIKPDQKTNCNGASTTPCLASGNYQIAISPDTEDKKGNKVEVQTNCGLYPLEANFKVNTNGIWDGTVPNLEPITIDGSNENPQKIARGQVHIVETKLRDNSGAGYVHLKLQKKNDNGSLTEISSSNFYDGPRVFRVGGSDAPDGNPYVFDYKLAIAAKAKTLETFVLTIEGWDIDNNKFSVSITYQVVDSSCLDGTNPDAEKGGECGVPPGGHCDNRGQCVEGADCLDVDDDTDENDKICVAVPWIRDVDPMEGAAGNYVTIEGKNFGNATGTIQFASGTQWITAKFPECNGKKMWWDRWAIVEVPDDFQLPQGNKGPIKLTADYTIKLKGVDVKPFDLTNDDFGPKPNVDGLFAKNDNIRPGLCSVETIDGAAPLPNAPVLALGKSFGDNQGGSYLDFGGRKPATKDWSATSIKSWVPESLKKGRVGVFVSTTKRSNILPFYVGDINDLNDYPVIESIDPASTTPGSLITIYGKNFGNTPAGRVFVQTKSGASAKECKSDDGCVELNVNLESLNKQCKATWKNDQVIAQVPLEIFQVLKTKLNTTSTEDITYDLLSLGGKISGALFTNSTTDKYTVADKENKMSLDGSFEYTLAMDFSQPVLLNNQGEKVVRFDMIKTGLTTTTYKYDPITKQTVLVTYNLGYRVRVDDSLVNGVLQRKFKASDIYGFDNPSDENSGGLEFLLPTSTNKIKVVIGYLKEEKKMYVLVNGTEMGSGGSGKQVVVSEGPGDFTITGDHLIINKLELKKIGIVSLQKDFVNLFIILRRGDIPTLQTNGEDRYAVRQGEPLPGICLLDPDRGPAPLAAEKKLNIYGINFTNNPTAHFIWKEVTSTEKVDSWLFTKVGNGITFATEKQIETIIPTSTSGYSMKTGPIKVKAKGELSNSAKYIVDSCLKPNLQKPGDNYHCCQKGPDEGLWLPLWKTCEGETRTAGYVWRFTTGKIADLPQVVEECNIADWDSANPNHATMVYPSPVPWSHYPQGQNACLNSTIAVRFNMGMDKTTINSSTVKVFKCGDKDQPECEKYENQLPETDLDLDGFTNGSRILEIRRSIDSDLEAGKWYRVVLLKSIMSRAQEIGPTSSTRKNLLPTNPLADTKLTGNEEVAYYYDFKTSSTSEKCVLKNAFIDPTSFTANLLGPVMNPWDPKLLQYFLVWGQGSQVCSVLDADLYTWQWSTANEIYAYAKVAPDSVPPPDGPPKYYKTRRGSAIANEETLTGVDIIASTTVDMSGSLGLTDILDLINEGKPIIINTSSQIKILNHLQGEDFGRSASFTVKIAYELNDISTSTTAGFSEDDYDPITEEPLSWTRYHYLYNKNNVDSVFIVERHFPNGDKTREFNFRQFVNPNGPMHGLVNLYHQVKYNKDKPEEWQKFKYIVQRKEGKVYLYYGDLTNLVAENKTENSDLVDLGAVVSIGGLKEDAFTNPDRTNLLGKITEFKIEKQIEGQKKDIKATSTLVIDLGDPHVVEWWPACEEACANGSVGVRFSRQMITSTYRFDSNSSIYVQGCGKDEFCANLAENDLTTNRVPVMDDLVKDDAMSYELVPAAGVEFNLGEWYRVTVSSSIKSIARLDSNTKGRSLQPFVWKFRVKSTDAHCQIDRVGVAPSPFTARYIGQRNTYLSMPLSKPDVCNANGQRLNPWSYGWHWAVENPLVAIITSFITVPTTELKPYCNRECLLLGSTVERTTEPSYLCGNGVVDPGEDCDIDVTLPDGSPEIPGVSCTLNCLRPGNTDSGPSTTLKQCGDRFAEPEKGEQCDKSSLSESAYCTDNCLWKGSSQIPPGGMVTSSWCSSGSVTAGETCDLKITSTSTPESKVGCSSNCLHLGTTLARYWCEGEAHANDLYGDKTIGESNECRTAVSRCGNGHLENGEECEFVFKPGSAEFEEQEILVSKGESSQNIQLKSSTANQVCSNLCLLQNICDEQSLESSDFYCPSDIEGCDKGCILKGSSVFYSTPSLCGDSTTTIGEYYGCELNQAKKNYDESPIQLATAVGEQQTDEVKDSLYTKVWSTALKEYNWHPSTSSTISVSGVTKPVTGTGDYYLQCGHFEYQSDSKIYGLSDDYWFEYNDCLENSAGQANIWGVAKNSCCYRRPERLGEYPIDGAGLDNDPKNLVCRNTFIEIKFDKYINQVSLNKNITIAGQHPAGYDCFANGEKEVTELVRSAFQLSDNSSALSFWGKIWQSLKNFFSKLFGGEVFASHYVTMADLENTVWCSGKITGTPKVSNDVVPKSDAKLSAIYPDNNYTVSSTVAIYINNAMDENTIYAIILKGGSKGVKDDQGVGIRNPDNVDVLNDAWLFKTGKDICKIKSVSVSPPSYLFTVPFSSSTFQAILETTGGQLIQSTPAYEYVIDWQPQQNNLFDIPLEVLTPVTDTIKIGARNVEGTLSASMQTKVLRDVSEKDNHTGKIFAGTTELTAKFCANPWPSKTSFPYKDTKFNFSMEYCADFGRMDTTTDDLPFLQQFDVTNISYDQLNPAQAGHCLASSTLACNTDSDCPSAYNMPHANSPTGAYTQKCPLGASTEQLLANNCNIVILPNGKYCDKTGDLYPPHYGSMYKSCTDDSECNASLGEKCQGNAAWNYGNWGVINPCVGALPSGMVKITTTSPVLTEDLLKRYLFFASTTDDAIGLQIFKLDDQNQSVNDWFKAKFPQAPAPQSATWANYEALTDGDNFYIKALNFDTSTQKIYQNIYHFSLSKSAQSETKNVFQQLLASLKFNNNILDNDFCLKGEVKSNGKLPRDENSLKIFGSVACNDDFACHDSLGSAVSSTNGVCANAKTKFFRDRDRLPAIQATLSAFQNYYDANHVYPDLPGGTYLQGYTMSRWPSWSNLSSLVGGLYSEQFNDWRGCDPQAEQQTCWKAASSTYSCPTYSMVTEYEYVTSTKSYKLHSPLEYFTLDDSFVAPYIIDKSHFTTEPWCTPSSTYSPFGEKCGDSVVQPGEQCDPPGLITLSNIGNIVTKICQVSSTEKIANYLNTNKECSNSVTDCGNYFMESNRHYFLGSADHYCVAIDSHNPNLSYPILKNPNSKNYLATGYEVFGCTMGYGECYISSTYNKPDVSEIQIFSSQSVATSTQNFLNQYFSNPQSPPNFGCVAVLGGVKQSICVGYQTSAMATSCPVGQLASTTCNVTCQWEHGSCTTPNKCGNGIVEQDEACDDGALNGTYGHCAGPGSFSNHPEFACHKLHPQYCDNDIFDRTLDGKPLEFCEFRRGDLKFAFSGTQLNATCHYDETVACSTNSDCRNSKAKAVSLGKMFGVPVKSYISADRVSKYLLKGDSDGFEEFTLGSTPTGYTITGWVKPVEGGSEGSGVYQNIFSFSDIEGKVKIRFDWNKDGTSGRFVYWDKNKSMGKSTLPPTSLVAAVDGPDYYRWYHFAVVVPAEITIRDKAVIYIDGENKTEFETDVHPSSTDRFSFGRIWWGKSTGEVGKDGAGTSTIWDESLSKDFFTGSMDELRVYSKPLSATDIESQYGIHAKGTYGQKEDGLVAGWHFDVDNTKQVTSSLSWTARDYSTHQINAKIVNSFLITSDKSLDTNETCVGFKVGEKVLLSYQDFLNHMTVPDSFFAGLCFNFKTCRDSVSSTYYSLLKNDTLLKGTCNKDKSVLCVTNNDCLVPATTDKLSTVQASASEVASKVKSSSQLVDLGLCNSSTNKFGLPYHFTKEASCSWDCQNYGDYCKDGKVNGNEQCDPKDPSGPPCNDNCTLKTIPPPICGNGGAPEGDEECDPGKHCENGKDCTFDGKCLADDYCAIRDTAVCSVKCKNIKAKEKICGNGLIESPNDAGVKEVCDNGPDNGQPCKPSYGKSCTYCTLDCKKSLAVDATDFCGNKKIDAITSGVGGAETIEKCDVLDPTPSKAQTNGNVLEGYLISAGTTLYCPDQGWYDCVQCKEIVNKCVACGYKKKEYGGATPNLTLYNLMTGSNESVKDQGKGWESINYAYLFNMKVASSTVSTTAFSVGVGQIRNYYPGSYLLGGIESSPLCKNNYYIYFGNGTFWPAGSAFNKKYLTDNGDLLPYEVNGEMKELSHSYTISPPVDPGVFRVAVSGADKDLAYLEVRNNFVNNGEPVSIQQAISWGVGLESENPGFDLDPDTEMICSEVNFKENCKKENFDGVYIHPSGALTIDTRDLISGNYAVYLANTAGQLKKNKKDIKIDVYEYRQGQKDWSVFNPTRTFVLKSADGTNASAPYWHAFNIVKRNGIYQIELVVDPDNIDSQTKQPKELTNGLLVSKKSDEITADVVLLSHLPDSSTEPIATIDNPYKFFVKGTLPQEKLLDTGKVVSIFTGDKQFMHYQAQYGGEAYGLLTIFSTVNPKLPVKNVYCSSTLKLGNDLLKCYQAATSTSAAYGQDIELLGSDTTQFIDIVNLPEGKKYDYRIAYDGYGNTGPVMQSINVLLKKALHYAVDNQCSADSVVECYEERGMSWAGLYNTKDSGDKELQSKVNLALTSYGNSEKKLVITKPLASFSFADFYTQRLQDYLYGSGTYDSGTNCMLTNGEGKKDYVIDTWDVYQVERQGKDINITIIDKFIPQNPDSKRDSMGDPILMPCISDDQDDIEHMADQMNGQTTDPLKMGQGVIDPLFYAGFGYKQGFMRGGFGWSFSKGSGFSWKSIPMGPGF